MCRQVSFSAGVVLAIALALHSWGLYAQEKVKELSPPPGSWEAWIQALKSDGKNGLPGRPDGKSLEDPLPLWVDCHLSWFFDNPKASQEKPKLAQRLVLESSPKDCKGRLEQWAR